MLCSVSTVGDTRVSTSPYNRQCGVFRARGRGKWFKLDHKTVGLDALTVLLANNWNYFKILLDALTDNI